MLVRVQPSSPWGSWLAVEARRLFSDEGRGFDSHRVLFFFSFFFVEMSQNKFWFQGDNLYDRHIDSDFYSPAQPGRENIYAKQRQEFVAAAGREVKYPMSPPVSLRDTWGMPSVSRGDIQVLQHVPTSGGATVTIYRDPMSGNVVHHLNLQTADYSFTGQAS